MRVAAQVESEMSVVLRRVFGLRLGAQHYLVHQFFDVSTFDSAEHGIEMAGRERAAATLARIMNSSIRRWATRRSGVITRSTVPSGLSRILRSGRSRSSGSRASRALLRAW